MDNLDITQIEKEKPIIYIQTFKENGNNFSLEKTLEILRPEYIILYHSDVSAVRQIELFESRKKQDEPQSKVYFMIHDKTVEEQAYLTSLKREKQAFELLIEAKSVSNNFIKQCKQPAYLFFSYINMFSDNGSTNIPRWKN